MCLSSNAALEAKALLGCWALLARLLSPPSSVGFAHRPLVMLSDRVADCTGDRFGFALDPLLIYGEELGDTRRRHLLMSKVRDNSDSPFPQAEAVAAYLGVADH